MINNRLPRGIGQPPLSRSSKRSSRPHSLQSSTNSNDIQTNHDDTLDVSPCSSSGSTTRRRLLAASAASLPSLSLSLPAYALKTIQLRDGSQAEVFEHGMSLSIVALRGSVPSQWVLDYRSTLGKYAGFGLGQRQQMRDIFEELSEAPGSRTKQSAALADVVTLGDSWLAPAIRNGLIQPLPNADHSRWFQSLDLRWQALVRRDPRTGEENPMGKIYAAPYRWNAGAMIAYRSDRMDRLRGRPIVDWADLLQPQLKGKIAFPSSTRVLLAIALMTLGLSPNASYSQIKGLTSSHLSSPISPHHLYRESKHAPLPPASSSSQSSSESSSSNNADSGHLKGCEVLHSGHLKGCEVLQHRVMELRGQALLFSDRDHIRAFTAGDAWGLVGSSQDLISTTERMSASNTRLVAPRSGCILTADLWVVPSGAGTRETKSPSPATSGPLAATATPSSSQGGPSPLLPSWLEFGASPNRSSQHSGLKTGATPSLLTSSPSPPPTPPHAAATHSHTRRKVKRDEKAVTSSSSSHPPTLIIDSSSHEDGDIDDNLLSSSSANYLPSRSVLVKSEFLLPLDSDMKECLRTCFTR